MKTHRCNESLKSKVSVRYDNEFDFGSMRTQEDWHLRQLVTDYEYCSKYLGIPIKIKYCPFCGEVLSHDI